MQAVILAAGIGRRLGKLTKEIPKCMVKVNGITLIESSLNNLREIGIDRIVIAVGHGKDVLINFLYEKFPDFKFIFVENSEYDRTNNIYSLYLAKDYLEQDDTILLESDIIYEKKILEKLIGDPREVLAVVDKYQSWMDGTVVKLDEEDNITAFIPKKFFDYEEVDEYYKTVNIYKFSREFMKDIYIPFLEAYIKVLGRNEYYELVLKVISDLEKVNIKALKLQGEKWYEIDTPQDIRNAECIFAPTPDVKLSKIGEKYGGYWRFPFLKDFCYLVNPHFPTKTMLSEMNTYFKELISEYPSTLKVLNHLVGEIFNVDERYVLVGNGASELINALSIFFQPTLGVVVPTFNEYLSRFKKVVKREAKYPDYRYSIEELKDLSKETEAILLVNPDNPTGNYISREEVLELLNFLSNNGKILILDESFIDFSEEGKTFLDNSILERYKNLIVVKSLGKSYGIPGLRLGVMATSNVSLLEKLKNSLPVWNINSLAEFFLQIFNKYKDDYLESCKKIKQERSRLYKKLSELTYLRVLPSEANYFMCEVLSPITAKDLTKKLLWDYDILIKDLSDKEGIRGEYVRIAVRSREENDILLKALHELLEDLE